MRRVIAWITGHQAGRFLKKNDPIIIAVTGSVGKTSATQAISTILESKYRVRKTIGNYNTDIGVPCSIFGRNIPESLKNPVSWLALIIKNELSLLHHSRIQVLVLEVGTDKPGEVTKFSWLKPDIAVVMAVAPEHMEFFASIDDVAKEELSVADYSKKVLVNMTMINKKYLKQIDKKKLNTFSRTDLKKYKIKPTELQVVGLHSLDSVVAGLVVGEQLGMDKEEMRIRAKMIVPQPGRMQLLKGKKETKLIDDTYNSSPEAAIAALDYLYSVQAPKRIVLLGNMNELGESSRAEHLSVGEHCDENKLDLVVTLGEDANKYTARAARAHGCRVEEAKTPYEAANIIEKFMEEGTVILLKGSQNGVFAEEATKLLLANREDQLKLVRQSAFWLVKKAKLFGSRDQ